MRRLARFCFTHRRLVVLGWLVALIGLTAIHSAVGSAYSDNFRLSGTQSFDAVNLLERNAPKASGDTEQVVVATGHGRVTDPAVRAQVQAMLAKLARQPHVTEISSPYGPRGAAQISPSGQVAFANATFDVQANKVSAAAAKNFVNAARAGSGNGVEIEVEGQVAQAANQQGAGGLPLRDSGRWHRVVHRVRVAARDGAAARDRGPIARNRCRRDRTALPRDPDGIVHE